MNKFFRVVFFFSIFCSTTNLIAQAKKMPAKKTVQNQLKPAVKKIAVKPARIDSATFINDVTQLKKCRTSCKNQHRFWRYHCKALQ